MAEELDMEKIHKTLSELKLAIDETKASIKDFKKSDSFTPEQIDEAIKSMTSGMSAKINTFLKDVKGKLGTAPAPSQGVSEERVGELVGESLKKFFADDKSSSQGFLNEIIDVFGFGDLFGE